MASAAGVFIDFLVSVFKFLMNMVTALLSLMVFLFSCMAAPWRLVSAVPNLMSFKDVSEFRKKCIVHALINIYYFLGLVCFVFTMLSWRGCIMAKKVFDDTDLDTKYDYYPNRPKIAIKQMFLALSDFFFLLLMIPLVFAPWRLVIFFFKAHKRFDDSSQPWYNTGIRSVIAMEVMLIFLDVLVLLFSIPIVFVPWRLYITVSACFEEIKNSAHPWFETSIHGVIGSNILLAFLDIVVTFCLIACFFMPWRFIMLLAKFVRLVRKERFVTKYQTVVIIYTLRGIADIPCLLIVCLPWRWVLFYMWARDHMDASPNKSLFQICFRAGLYRNILYGLLDIFLLPFMALLLFFPWRWYFFYQHASATIGDKKWYQVEFRGDIIYHSVLGLVDVVLAFPLLCLLVFVPWRLYALVKIQQYESVKQKVPIWSLNAYGAIILCVFLALIETFLLVCIVFVHLTFWRLPEFYEAMKAARTDDRPWYIETSDYYVAVLWHGVCSVGDLVIIFPMVLFVLVTIYRVMWFYEGIQLILKDESITSSVERTSVMRKFVCFAVWSILLDFLTLFPLLFVFLTMIRIPTLFRDWPKSNSAEDIRLHILMCACYSAVDIPCVICGMFTIMSVVRVRVFIFRDLKNAKTNEELWLSCVTNAVFAVRDIIAVFFLVMYLLPCGVYRFYFAVSECIEATRSRAPPRPHLNITSFRICFENPHDEKGGKAFLRIQGTKDAGFTFTKNVKLYLRDVDWDKFAANMGSGKTTVVRGILPLRLDPEILTTSMFPVGATTFDLDIPISKLDNKKRTMLKTLNTSLCHVPMRISIEFDDGVGTLFETSVLYGNDMAECIVAAAPWSIQPYDPEDPKHALPPEPSSWIEDVLWWCVLVQVVHLTLDFTVLVPTLWVFATIVRVKTLLKDGPSGSACEMRLHILKCALFVFLDIPSIIVSAFVILTVWRAPALFQDLKNSKKDADIWGACWMNFLLLFRDLPILILSLVCLVPFVYRFVLCVQQAREQAQTNGRKFVDEYWKIALHHVLQQFIDIAGLILIVLIHFFAPHRALWLWSKGRETKNKKLLGKRLFRITSLRHVVEKMYHAMEAHEWGVESMVRSRSGGNSVGYALTETSELPGLIFNTFHLTAAVVLDDPEIHGLCRRSLEMMGASHSLTCKKFSDTLTGGTTKDLGFTDSDLDTIETLAMYYGSNAGLLSTDCAQLETDVLMLEKTLTQQFKEMHMCSNESQCDLMQLRNVAFLAGVEFLYDTLALLCFIVLMCTGYRTIPTLIDLWNAKSGRRRYCLALFVLEIPIDILYMIQFGIVIVTLHNAPKMIMDILILLPRQPSFENARIIIGYYCCRLAGDCGNMCSNFATCRTIQFIMATFVWGAFSPAILILETGVMDGASNGTIICVALFTCTFIYGCPFLAVFGVANLKGVYAFFGLTFFILVVSLLLSAYFRWSRQQKPSHDDDNKGLIQITTIPVQFLRLSATHAITTYGWLMLETLQLVALLYPDSELSKFVLLEYDVGRDLPLGFYVAVALTLLHYFVASLPVVLEDMMEWHSKGEVSNWRAWLLTSEALTTLVFVFILHNLSLPARHAVADDSFGFHKNYLITSFLMIIFYVPTALLKDRKRTAAAMNMLSVYWDELGRMALQVILTSWVCMSTISTSDPITRSTLSIAFSLVAILVYGGLMKSGMLLCSVTVIAQYRGVLLVCVFVISVISRVLSSNTTVLVLADCVVGLISWLAMWLLLRRARSIRQPDSLEGSAGDIQRHLLDFEDLLLGTKKLAPIWQTQCRTAWLHDVGYTLNPAVLAKCTVTLESHIRLAWTSKEFLLSRDVWLKNIQHIAHDDDAISLDWLRRKKGRSMRCCDDDDDDRSDKLVLPPLPVRVEELQRLVQALRNSILDAPLSLYHVPKVPTFETRGGDGAEHWGQRETTSEIFAAMQDGLQQERSL